MTAIDGSGDYNTRAGECVQIGGTVSDVETDQIVVRLSTKDYSTMVNKERASFATGASAVYTASYQLEIVGVAAQLGDDQPGERIGDLLDDIERALMTANTISAGGRRYPVQIISADFSLRDGSANTETVSVTIRLSGTQSWINE